MTPGKTTLAAFLERWIEDYWPNLSPPSYERYRDIVKKGLIPNLGSIALTQLRPEHLQKVYTAMQKEGLGARTVRYHHAVIHVALKTAHEWGLVARNPADAIRPPNIHRNEMQTWDEQ